MDLNKLTLIGNLTRDPEERRLPSGQPLVTFTVATNLVWRDAKTKEVKEAVEFHRVVVWGQLVPRVLKNLEKGSRVYVEGRLRQRSWKDEQGVKRYIQEVSASEIIFLSGSRHASPETAEVIEESPEEMLADHNES